MAKLVKCPRCSASIDVTQLSGGTTVRCAECGAMVRIPTGQTGVHPKVPVSAPPAAPPAPGGTAVRARTRGTEIRRSPSRIVRPRSSNTGVLVAAIVSAAAVLIVLIVVLARPSSAPQPPARIPSAPPAVARTPAPAPEPPPAAPEPPPAAAPATPAVPVARGAEDPSRVNWDELMKALRPGGGFEDLGRPEGQAFARVKAMGKGAYPYLLRYLDHEELPLAVAAARVLNELTGRQQPLPTPATRAQVKADWEAWIKANP